LQIGAFGGHLRTVPDPVVEITAARVDSVCVRD
jgi:hypothetical protein